MSNESDEIIGWGNTNYLALNYSNDNDNSTQQLTQELLVCTQRSMLIMYGLGNFSLFVYKCNNNNKYIYTKINKFHVNQLIVLQYCPYFDEAASAARQNKKDSTDSVVLAWWAPPPGSSQL